MDKKIKNLLIIFIVVIFCGIVVGLTIGQTASQAQFDAFDFSNENFNFALTSVDKYPDKAIFNVDFVELQKQEDGTWKVVAAQLSEPVSKRFYNDCRMDGNTTAECIGYVKQIAKNRILNKRDNMRSYYTSKQTEFWDEVAANDLNDVSFN